MAIDSESFEKRFTAMEEKVNIMTDFINSLKASVEEKKAEPQKKDLLDDLLDFKL